MLWEKIDFVNKISPYVIKFVAQVVTVLSILFRCVVVAELFFSFYLDPAMTFRPLCNVMILVSTHMSAAINCTTGSTLDTNYYNTSIMEKQIKKLHRFKTMAI